MAKGYMLTGKGLVKRDSVNRITPAPITKTAPLPPGLVTEAKVNRDADKYKRRGK